MKGWHFLQDSKRLRYGTTQIVESGGLYTAHGPLVVCRNGMHASKRIIDALSYAPGSIVCRVDVTGELIHKKDKFVGRERRVLWMLDATLILHEFACRCAEDVIHFIPETHRKPFLHAIATKRQWIAGVVSNQELAAARDAARDAAWAAARAAACDAAWAAAWDAAWAAACDAARAAACDAARDEILKTFNRRLTAMIMAARKITPKNDKKDGAKSTIWICTYGEHELLTLGIMGK